MKRMPSRLYRFWEGICKFFHPISSIFEKPKLMREDVDIVSAVTRYFFSAPATNCSKALALAGVKPVC